MLRIARAVFVVGVAGLVAGGVSACSSGDNSAADTSTASQSDEATGTTDPAADETAGTTPDPADTTTTSRVYSALDLDSSTQSCIDAGVADNEGAQKAIADDANLDGIEPVARGVLFETMIDCGVPVAAVILGSGATPGSAAYAECIVAEAGDDLAEVIAGVGFAENPPAPAQYRDVTIDALAACGTAGIVDVVPSSDADRFAYLSSKCMETLGLDRTKFLIDATYSLGESPTDDEVQAVADRYGVEPAEAVGGSMSCTVTLPTSVSMIETQLGGRLGDDTFECLSELDPVALGSQQADAQRMIRGCLSEDEADAFDAVAEANQ